MIELTHTMFKYCFSFKMFTHTRSNGLAIETDKGVAV